MKDHRGRTPLSWAAGRAEIEVVRVLIQDYHVDPSTNDNDGRTPLSWAAGNEGALSVFQRNKPLETVELFLGISQVDPDAEDFKGRTPLAWAVFVGRTFLVERLLDSGKTDPFRRFDGHSLLDWAMKLHQTSVAVLLIEKGLSGSKMGYQVYADNFKASHLADRMNIEYTYNNEYLPPRKLLSLFRLRSRS